MNQTDPKWSEVGLDFFRSETEPPSRKSGRARMLGAQVPSPNLESIEFRRLEKEGQSLFVAACLFGPSLFGVGNC